MVFRPQLLSHPRRRRRDKPRSVLGISCAAALLLATGCGSSHSTSSSSAATKTTPAASTSTTIDGVAVSSDAKLHAMVPGSASSAGRIVVASDPTEPPWDYHTAPGSSQFTGAEYDLLQAVGATLGVRFAVTAEPFPGIIPGLLSHKYQIGAANLGDTSVREQSLDFVDYALDGDGILVRKGNPDHIVKLTDACGKNLAIVTGSNYQTYLQSNQKKLCGTKPMHLASFPSDAVAQLAVKSGKAVGSFTDGPETAYLAKSVDGGAAFQAVHDPAAPAGYDPVPIGVALLKSNSQLTKAVQAAMQDLMTSGAARTIFGHYGLGSYIDSKPTVNGATPTKGAG